MNELVERCRRIAAAAHDGQTRRKGEDAGKPYIVHPERVAGRFADETLQAVAWLHDVVEDTLVSARSLEFQGVQPEVVDAVMALTRRGNENYLDFILRVAKNPMARLVKMADLEDNMTSLEEGSLKDKYRLALYVLRGMSQGGHVSGDTRED